MTCDDHGDMTLWGVLQRRTDCLSKWHRLQAPQKVGVFDLDGCLFDTRHRQVMIMREYASRFDEPLLYHINASHFTDWNLKTPFGLLGCLRFD